MNNERQKPEVPPILATFETPEQDLAEVYELDEEGRPRVVKSAAVDRAKPGPASMEFSAEELTGRRP